MSSEFQYACEKCPRTFKLQEFYDKHKKVHDLKKQHRCHICGFVYGAAKGLEGHLKSHEEGSNGNGDDSGSMLPPYNVDFHFLNPRGVLAEASIPMTRSPTLIKEEDDSALSPLSKNGGKVPSPSGTGSYEVFEAVPEISDASAVVQNDSGFFMCSICNREFSGLNSLKKHIPIHTRRIQHRCDACGFVFGKKEYLWDHMRKHTGEVSPVCEVCGQTFNKSLKLKEHFKVHRNTNPATSSSSPYQCHVCRAVFNRAAILGSHLATAHAETVYKCDICEATFGDVRGKNHHMYNAHQHDAFHQKCVWCVICSQGFTRHYNLKVHMSKSHGKEFVENNFTAAEWAAMTRPPTGASAVIAGRSPPKVPSPGGSSGLFNAIGMAPALGQAYFDTKNGTQMFPCQMCPEKFIRKSDLYIHLDSDHGVLLIGCTSCDDKFLGMVQLQEHIQTVHKAVKRKPGPASRTNGQRDHRITASGAFKCKDCLKAFGDEMAYVQHMRMIHGRLLDLPNMPALPTVPLPQQVDESDDEEDNAMANNPLAIIIKNLTEAAARKAGKNVSENCNFCERVFESHNDLMSHIISTHFKGFYFPCELCGKAFPQQENLDAHVRAKHPNIAKRAQHLKSALGLGHRDGNSPAKRARFEDQPIRSKPGPLSSKSRAQQQQQRASTEQIEVEATAMTSGEAVEDEIRYEPITEAFIFETQIIHPCYVVLPFVTKREIQLACNISRNGLYLEDTMDDEVPLTIDESMAIDDDDEEEEQPIAAPSPVKNLRSVYNAEDLDPCPNHGFYPALPDFSLPFTMANLWKKKADLLGPVAAMQQVELMEKIERMQKYNGSPVADSPSPPPPASISLPQTPLPMGNGKRGNSNGSSPKTNISGKKNKSKSMSPQKNGHNNGGEENMFVTVYESQIQDEIWPLNCLKCNLIVANLESFNLHMNDHWSEDKCCPICGLLINSKRFNFKQHLKIHTGEKPFVCAICNRSFRQKAHMVKHVTTHRGVPNIQEVHAAAVSAK